MKTPQNIQPSFNDKISIADIIYLFKSHKKMILIFVIIGTLLGSLYGNFIGAVYKGSILISPAKFSGDVLVSPKIILAKLSMNSFYSKETVLNCNPRLYKDKDKDIDSNVSSLITASITKDSELIKLHMQHKNKVVIKDCLNSVYNDIRMSQDRTIEPLIQQKKNELTPLEKKLTDAENFKIRFTNKQDKKIKELKNSGEHFAEDLLYMNMFLINSDIQRSITEIIKLRYELSSIQTKSTEIITHVNLEKNLFPTPKLCALVGFFLGLCLAILITLIKEMKI